MSPATAPHPPVPATVGAIWAQSPDGIIGRDGGIPWRVPEDLRFFARVTTGHPVIMGRRTWESFPDRFRPLPHRPNIVVTSRPDTVPEDGTSVWAKPSYPEALRLAESMLGAAGEIWAIGGTGIWAAALAEPRLPLTRALVTTVDLTVTGDTRAPALDGAWRRTRVADWATSSTGVRYRVDEYRRADDAPGPSPVPAPGASGGSGMR